MTRYYSPIKQKKNNDCFVIKDVIYTDAADYLNKPRFSVSVPLYVLRLPKAIEKEEIIPSWYRQVNSKQIINTSLTISRLIELLSQRIYFKINNKKDLIRIYKYITLYINSYPNLETIDPIYVEYFKKAKKFQDCILDIILRLSRNDEYFKLEITKNNSIYDLLNKYQ